MTDIERGGLSVEGGLDSKNAFREAYMQAEIQAAQEAGLVTDQPRDPETGQFVTAEPEVVEQPEVVEEQPVEVDPAAARIAELEAQLAEKESFIGRQSTEIGELRRTVEERLDQFGEQLAQPQPQRQYISPDLIDRDPATAAQLAFEQGDAVALQAAVESWQAEDPFRAAAWVSQKTVEAKVAEVEQRAQQKLAALEQEIAPLRANRDEAELAQHLMRLPEETRAFISDSDTLQALANEFPSTGKLIATGSPQERVEAIQTLYSIHRGRTADTLTRTAQDAARETAEAAQAARDDAYVASSTASAEQVKTFEQIEQEKAVAAFTRGRSVWDDAFVKPTK